jgi:hypothetical protein
LDSLASELDALRSHWETNKSYRLSNTFDFEKTSVPTSAATVDGEVPGWSRSWREKLEQEERNGAEAAASQQQQQQQQQGSGKDSGSEKPSGDVTPTRGEYEGLNASQQQQEFARQLQGQPQHANVI